MDHFAKVLHAIGEIGSSHKLAGFIVSVAIHPAVANVHVDVARASQSSGDEQVAHVSDYLLVNTSVEGVPAAPAKVDSKEIRV